MKHKVILMMCMCALFASCNNESETAPVDPNPINISQSEREESTLVTFCDNYGAYDNFFRSYYVTSFSATICDKNGKQVGGGSNIGSYLVPHGGNISVEWTWVYNNDVYHGSETVFVGSAYEIRCYLNKDELSLMNF